MQTGVSWLETAARSAKVRLADIEPPSLRVEKAAAEPKQAYRNPGSKMDQEFKSLEGSLNRGSEIIEKKLERVTEIVVAGFALEATRDLYMGKYAND